MLHVFLQRRSFAVRALRFTGLACAMGLAACGGASDTGTLRLALIDDPEDSIFKRAFSFPMAPLTRHPTRLSRSSTVAEIY